MEDKELYTIFVRILKGLLWENPPPKRDIMTVLSKRCEGVGFADQTTSVI